MLEEQKIYKTDVIMYNVKSLFDDDPDLSELCNRLNQLRDKHNTNNYYKKLYLGFGTDYDGCTEITLYGERLETDEELKKRTWASKKAYETLYGERLETDEELKKRTWASNKAYENEKKQLEQRLKWINKYLEEYDKYE